MSNTRNKFLILDNFRPQGKYFHVDIWFSRYELEDAKFIDILDGTITDPRQINTSHNNS